jgi:hypothetical protein
MNALAVDQAEVAEPGVPAAGVVRPSRWEKTFHFQLVAGRPPQRWINLVVSESD